MGVDRTGREYTELTRRIHKLELENCKLEHKLKTMKRSWEIYLNYLFEEASKFNHATSPSSDTESGDDSA